MTTLTELRTRWESPDRPGGTIARDDVLLLVSAVENVVTVVRTACLPEDRCEHTHCVVANRVMSVLKEALT